MTQTIGVFLGSVRAGRFGEGIANWVLDQAREREGFEYRLLDLAEFNVPHIVAELPPAAANKQYDDEAVTRWSEAVDACDAFIFITPEYNRSVPGTMKNAFDSLFLEWANKPVGFIGYGSDGGPRAVEHWRLIVSNPSMQAVRSQVAISTIEDVVDGKFTPREIKRANLDAMLTAVEERL